MKKFLSILITILILFLTSCEFSLYGPSEEEPEVHSCYHKCAICEKCRDMNCTDPACADKCPGHNDPPVHVCSHVCPECGKCLDKTCTDPVCADKCQGHEPVNPIIKKITCSNPYLDYKVGDAVFLDTVYRTNIELEAGDSFTFESSDDNVAKVNSTGYLIAMGKGYCTITISYEDVNPLVLFITVTQDTSFTAPIKLEYYKNESVDLTGAKITYFDKDGGIDKEIDVTPEMISGFDTTELGSKEVTVKYDGETYKFAIEVKQLANQPYLLNGVSFPSSIKQNERLDIKVNNLDMKLLQSTLESMYDYTKYKIAMEITSPKGKKDTIYAFYTKDYIQTKVSGTPSTSKSLEGTVNTNSSYNYKYTYKINGDPFYMLRYNPEESGKYSYTVKVYVNNSSVVQTLDGNFNVSAGDSSKGIIKVSSNKRTFEFENGDTYLAVGENVAWYTSSERRLGDYEMWFKSLAENNGNFARVWLAGWGYSLFWKDVKNYDTKLDEAYELDKLFEMAEEYGIYIDLSFFQHGMFSASVNPMWPNNSNTWYIDKYGANPYSKILNSPGEFFTSSEAKKWTKNYITYIVSRYGYSTSLLSYELFNEVDWVESYTATTGSAWHDEMAKYIKSVDYQGHLVTTSVKGDDFSSKIYDVFKLESIDYVNVHAYGSGNYLKYIPGKVKTAYQTFDKPIMYQEVGYSGNGGADQINKDPNDVSLHQELWAGLMTCGATGMNWWWDSWIEVKKTSYEMFKAPGKIADMMDLSGSMSLVYGNSNVSSSSSSVTPLGYLFSNKAYIYLFNTNYSVSNQSVSSSTKLSISGMEKASYEVTYYNTLTGAVISTETATVSTLSPKLSINTSFTNDIMIIIKKK